MQVTETIVARPATRSRLAALRFTLQASRPGLWATAAWFYLLPLGQKNLFESVSFWTGLFYVTFPLGLFLYGCNDLVDRETDAMNPRKGSFLFGARGSAAELASLRWQIVWVQLPFVAVFTSLAGLKMLGWFAATTFFTALYNAPRYGLKSHPPLDIVIQAGYLMVFLLSSWLNQVAQLPVPAMIFGALFAMHSHVFGEIMDIEPDRASGRRTTATVLGRVPSKLLISGLLLVEGALIAHFFADKVMAALLAAGAAWFVLDALLLWRNRACTTAQMRFFLLAWNLLALGSMAWVWQRASLIRITTSGP